MASPQVRIAEEIVAAAQAERGDLGFPVDASIATVVSELAREGLAARRARARHEHRVALYAQWAGDAELSDDVRDAMRWAIEGGVA
jgi:hypothetical protein